MINSILHLRDLVIQNYIQIIGVVSLSLLFYLTYRITTGSLKKLKMEVLNTYPFDLFIPKGGAWSISYFLIMVIFLGLLIYFFLSGKFYIGPA